MSVSDDADSIAVESIRSGVNDHDRMRIFDGGFRNDNLFKDRDQLARRIHYGVTLVCVFVTGFLLIRYMEMTDSETSGQGNVLATPAGGFLIHLYMYTVGNICFIHD